MNEDVNPCNYKTIKTFLILIFKCLSLYKGDDFYKFSCGGFEKKTMSSDDATSYLDDLQTKLIVILKSKELLRI